MSRFFGPPLCLTTVVVLLVGLLRVARAQDVGLAPESLGLAAVGPERAAVV